MKTFKILLMSLIAIVMVKGVHAQNVNPKNKNLLTKNVPFSNIDVISNGEKDNYFTFRSNWGFAGESKTLDVLDGIAYWGNGTVLKIMDETDPANPVELSHVNIEGEIADIEARGGYVYIATQMNGLFIVDASDLSLPEVIGWVDVPLGYGWVLGLEVYNGYAYFCTRFGTAIIDATDPANPVIVNSTTIPEARDPHAVNGYLYVPVASSGLELNVFNLNDPGQPTLAGTFWDGGQVQAFSVYVDGDYLYYCKPTEGVGIVNISDTSNIFQESLTYGSGETYVRDIEVKDGYLYAASTEGVDIFDVSDPTSISFDNNIDLGYLDAWEVEIYNDYIFYAHQTGLKTLQITNPGNAQLINTLNSGGWVARIATKDNHVFAPGEGYLSAGRFYSINTEDIDNPVLADDSDVDPGLMMNIEIKGDFAYVSQFYMITVFDISDPDNMVFVEEHFLPTPMLLGLTISGDHLFAVDLDGLHIYEILSNGHLNYITQLLNGTTYASNEVVVEGDMAYISCQGPSVTEGVVVCADISNINNPQIVSTHYVPDELFTIAVHDNFVYTGGAQDQIMVIDVSDPSDPNTVNIIYIGDEAYITSMRVIDEKLFVTNGICRAYSIDGDDLDEAGYFAPYSYKATETIKGEGNILYIADITGVSIVEYDFTTQIADNPKNANNCYNFPNPFNSNTTITFENVNSGKVNLAIFNSEGQKVITVVDEVLPAGIYNKTINTKNLDPGIYYYNIETSQSVQSKKMIKVN